MLAEFDGTQQIGSMEILAQYDLNKYFVIFFVTLLFYRNFHIFLLIFI